MDNVKYEGEFITKEIFCSLIAIDGRMSDMTQEKRNEFVKKLYKNTNNYLLKWGILIPLKASHMDLDPVLKGFVQSLELKKKKYVDNNNQAVYYYTIIAKMFMYKDFYETYKSGRLPGISIEYYDEGSLPNGELFGEHISAVSFNGTDPIAQPWLNNPNFQKHGNVNNYKSINYTRHNETKKYKIKEFDKMAIPTKEEILSAIIEVVEKMYEGADPAVSEPVEQPAPEDEMAVDEEEMKCDDQKYSRMWEDFSKRNKIPKTSREQFIKVARSNGEEFAKDLFVNHLSLPKPPTEGKFTSDNSVKDGREIDNSDVLKYIQDRGLRVDPRIIEKYRKGGNK